MKVLLITTGIIMQCLYHVCIMFCGFNFNLKLGAFNLYVFYYFRNLIMADMEKLNVNENLYELF